MKLGIHAEAYEILNINCQPKHNFDHQWRETFQTEELIEKRLNIQIKDKTFFSIIISNLNPMN